MQRVTLHRADQGQRHPGTAARVFDDRPVGRQAAIGLGSNPAGEGAGFAGGILSAGVDGIKVGEAVARSLLGAAA